MQNVKDLTRQLVAFETTSALSNMAIALFLREILLGMGFAVDLQEKISPNGDSKKANLIARIGPKDVEPLMLSAHMDTVSAGDSKAWKTKPFELTEVGDELYGRGSADMKGPLAALICAIEPLVQNKEAMKRELIFGLTFDEEVGLVGARYMEKESEVGRTVLRPKFVLVAEPTELIPMRMHKGHLCLRAVCHGQSAHGSKPDEGVNAIELAAEVVAILQRFRDEELKGEQEACIDPPYATLNIGVIRGGTKYNIIPSYCFVDFEVRPIPGQSAEGIKDDLTARMEDIGWDDQNKRMVDLDFQEIGEPLEPPKPGEPHKPKKSPTEPVCTPPDSLLVQVAEQVTGQPAAGASFSTDASILQNLGGQHKCQCLILGPGSIEQAHKENEFIETKQLLLAVEQFREIVRRICF